jgi:hypothetical protein
MRYRYPTHTNNIRPPTYLIFTYHSPLPLQMLPFRQLRAPVVSRFCSASSSSSLSVLRRHNQISIARGAIQRTMATESPKKMEWLVILPDKEGAIDKRMEVRPYVPNSVYPTFHFIIPPPISSPPPHHPLTTLQNPSLQRPLRHSLRLLATRRRLLLVPARRRPNSTADNRIRDGGVRGVEGGGY